MSLQMEVESVCVSHESAKKPQQWAPADAEPITMLKIIQEFKLFGIKIIWKNTFSYFTMSIWLFFFCFLFQALGI